MIGQARFSLFAVSSLHLRAVDSWPNSAILIDMRTIKGGIRFEIKSSSEMRDEQHATEHNDCVVRALAVAAGVPYADAHSFWARAGRRPRHGMKTSAIEATLTSVLVYGYKVTRTILPMFCNRLGGAMLHMRQGRYLIIKAGHAIGCIDGVLYDFGTVGPTSRVIAIYKFTPSSEWETIQAACDRLPVNQGGF